MKNIALAFAIACASGFAQSADDFYKAPDQQNNTITTKNVYRIDHASGITTFSLATGGTQSYSDPASSLFQRILANQPEFVKIGNSYVNPVYAARIACSNGRSIYSLQAYNITVTADDGCIAVQSAYNKAK